MEEDKKRKAIDETLQSRAKKAKKESIEATKPEEQPTQDQPQSETVVAPTETSAPAEVVVEQPVETPKVETAPDLPEKKPAAPVIEDYAKWYMLPQTVEEFEQVMEFDSTIYPDKPDASPIAKIHWKQKQFEEWVLKKFQWKMKCLGLVPVFDSPLFKFPFGYSPRLNEKGNLINNLWADILKGEDGTRYREVFENFENVLIEIALDRVNHPDKAKKFPIRVELPKGMDKKTPEEQRDALKMLIGSKLKPFIRKNKDFEKYPGYHAIFKYDSKEHGAPDVNCTVYDGDNNNKTLTEKLIMSKHAWSKDENAMEGKERILCGGDTGTILWTLDRSAFYLEWGVGCVVKEIKRFAGENASNKDKVCRF